MEELDIVAESKVAERFGLSIKTLRNWGSAGYGPVRVPVGRNAFYSESDIRAWFQELAALAAADMRAKNPRRLCRSRDNGSATA